MEVFHITMEVFPQEEEEEDLAKILLFYVVH